MVLEHYISDLLYRYNCVVVPGLGAFLSQTKPATLNKQTNSFYPPSKSLSFNKQLSSNDGLLVSYMAEVEKCSYEEMLPQVTEQIAQWKHRLDQGDRLSLENIGDLKMNKEGRILFQPSYEVNHLTSSFGLSSFVSSEITREILKQEVVGIEEKVPFIITPERRNASSWRPYMKYAAILLLALSTGLTGYRFYMGNLDQQQLVVEKAQEKVSQSIQEATFFDTAPLELPTLSLKVATKKPEVAMHHIVAGAFRFKVNADKKINELKRRGYNATYLGTNDHGLHMVTFSSYTDVDEALKNLRTIKSTQSKDAWLLSVR
ncbi:SPOR domain-containing protein [Maribacter polysaccharolyticus]|uniref:HU domain-containing protein n=1 Tax=Maribacter polysaccharolyticus TaxID=3020831 RepID=UPI00237F5ECC|nr:SPOR domain-containing protein [Maribacter polysaccharolyticus]MDE3742257.1 SPOR domain-containing protein [Maribacter polysaccharolyticus]